MQGLGAALLSPAALSLVTVLFAEGAERNKAMGVWGAVAGSGGAVGVLLGGMLTEWAGWEWVLFVNVPIGIAAALLAPRLLPESRNEGARHFDIAGAVTITAGLSLLVYALVDANDAGWGSTQTLGLGAISLALIASFFVIERRTQAPLVPFPASSGSARSPASTCRAVLVAASLFSMFFFISLYMQQVLGFSALKAGLAYLPLAVGIIVSAGAASQLVTRFGFKPVLVDGLILTAGGLVWFSQVAPDGSYVGDILFPSLLAAVGLGLAFVPMTVAAVSGVEPHEAGLASGLINTSQQIGGALGLAILATVANSRTDGRCGRAARRRRVALTEGFQAAFLVGAAFAVGAGIAVLGAILAITSSPAAPRASTPRRRSAARSTRSPSAPDGGFAWWAAQRRPPGPRDQRGLDRQPQPQQRLGDAAEALGVDGHVHVGREHGDERGDQPPAGPRARGAGHEHPDAAGDLRHAARIDELAVRGQSVGHDRRVRRRA